MDQSENDPFLQSLCHAASVMHLRIVDEQKALMRRHYKLVLEANRQVNLTRITDAGEAAVKHYVDSLMVASWVDSQQMAVSTVLDIGTGGGFPAIPLAVYRPQWRITAIDGSRKKTRCVEHFVQVLGLPNCTVIHRRAEHWREPDCRFDLIVGRAVGPMAELLKGVRRLCHEHTVIVCYKAVTIDDSELSDAGRDAQKYHFQPYPPWTYVLHVGQTRVTRQLRCFRRSPTSP